MLTDSSLCVHQDYSGLDGVCLADAVELVEVSRDTLDDVWRQNDHDPFPETRMLRLMDVIGMPHTHTHCSQMPTPGAENELSESYCIYYGDALFQKACHGLCF
jgi:hypothetical protein